MSATPGRSGPSDYAIALGDGRHESYKGEGEGKNQGGGKSEMTGPLRSGAVATSDVRLYKRLALVVIAVFLLLGARLWQLQVIKGDRYYRRTADNFVKEIELQATRGQLLDRNGRILVDNRPSYSVYLKPTQMNDAVLGRLERYLGLKEEQSAVLRAKVAAARARKGAERFQELLVFEDITRDQMGALESDAAELPGLTVKAVAHRAYPHSKLAAHALGYMNQITAEELSQLRDQGYRPGDYIGRAGLERQWESYLRGKDGVDRVIQDARGHIKTDLDENEVVDLIGGPRRHDPEPGANVVLTLDLDLQRITEQALSRHHSAAAVVVDVATGKVLALSSYPAFDPNVLTGHLTRDEAERLQNDPFRPLIDKAVQENFFPASTFKIIPALAGLEEHFIDAHEKTGCRGAYELPGHAFHCMKSHGPVNLYSALVESCNVYFYRLGEKVGMDRMARMAQDFGFGAPTGIGLPGEAPGFVPTQDFYRKHGGFRIGYSLNTAIGQGSTKVTVVQEALAYAALSNGGKLYVPQLVERIETPTGQVVQRFEPRLRRQLEIRPEDLAEVRRALCGVVNDPKGTSHSAYDPSLSAEVCGKSGTAQLGKNRKGEAAGWDKANDHAWFVGFAPAHHPEIAIAVLAEHGGLGGHVAAPTAMAILKGYFNKVKKPAQAALPPGARTGAGLGPRHDAVPTSAPLP